MDAPNVLIFPYPLFLHHLNHHIMAGSILLFGIAEEKCMKLKNTIT
jgi:hypothetical protein